MGRDKPPENPTYTPPAPYTQPETKIPEELKLSPEEQAYKKQLQGNLANFDSVYAPQYALEQQAFKDQLQKNIFDTFDPIERKNREAIATRLGGLGNRAYVDSIRETERMKQGSIAEQMNNFILNQAERKQNAQNDLLNKIAALNNTTIGAYNMGLGLATPFNNYNLNSANQQNEFNLGNYQNQIYTYKAEQDAKQKRMQMWIDAVKAAGSMAAMGAGGGGGAPTGGGGGAV